jgi:transposase-like protein
VLARELEVSPNLLHRWRSQYREAPEQAFPGKGNPHRPESGVAELERKIGQQAVEIDFLKACLQRIERQRMLQASIGNPRSTARSTRRSSAKPGSKQAR